jgi:hypothetical protein
MNNKIIVPHEKEIPWNVNYIGVMDLMFHLEVSCEQVREHYKVFEHL